MSRNEKGVFPLLVEFERKSRMWRHCICICLGVAAVVGSQPALGASPLFSELCSGQEGGCGNIGFIAERPRVRQAPNAAALTLTFGLSFDKDVRGTYPRLTTEERVKQFVEPGISLISSLFGLDPAAWKVRDSGAGSAKSQVDSSGRTGKVVVFLESPWVPPVRAADIGQQPKGTVLLLRADPRFKQGFEYRYFFDAAVKASWGDLAPKRVAFSVDVLVQLHRKGTGESDKRWTDIGSRIPPANQRTLTEYLSRNLFEIYFQALKDLGKQHGFKVVQPHP